MTAQAAPAAARVLASSAGGNVATADGMLYLLTECCEASGTGSSGSPTGVACRACYRPVPDRFGWAVMADAPYAAESLAAVLLEAWADPTPARNRPVALALAAHLVAQASGPLQLRCGARVEPGGCQTLTADRAPCGAYRCPEHMPSHLAQCDYRGPAR